MGPAGFEPTTNRLCSLLTKSRRSTKNANLPSGEFINSVDQPNSWRFSTATRADYVQYRPRLKFDVDVSCHSNSEPMQI
jgi:hypothetical protein